MSEDWLGILERTVRTRRLAVFRFHGEEWYRLRESRRGLAEFTTARSHDLLDELQAPTACLILGEDEVDAQAHFGLVSSRAPVSTLESRLKVTRAQEIQLPQNTDHPRLVTRKPHSTGPQRLLDSNDSVVVPSSELSAHLVRALAELEPNHGAMRVVADALASFKGYGDMASLQHDAIQTALRAFGLSTDEPATSLDLIGGEETTLARVSILEDAVIEHDARHVPGYILTGSDLTGRATFLRNSEKLEVYTANRRPLEQTFGVDLIYLNLTRQNIVMLQYKMLERNETLDGKDWIYRPDDRLESEIERMRRFQQEHSPNTHEYRLNSEVFYLKFVKRDNISKNASITMPIDHFQRLRKDPTCRGPKGGFRISFNSLAGRYLRQNAFLDLIHSGYIGAHSETTENLRILVEAVVQGGKAAVAAIQAQIDGHQLGSKLSGA